MNIKRMLLKVLIGNDSYCRLVRLNVIQEAGVVGRRARVHKVNDMRQLASFEPFVLQHDRHAAVSDHLRMQLLGELPRHSTVDYNKFGSLEM